MHILYSLFVVVAWLVSRLPLPLLYVLSEILGFLLHHVFRYRRKVVALNLSRAFPDKDKHEVRSIARQYYRNLADIILETIKKQSISKSNLAGRISFKNDHILDDLYARGKSVMVTIGHCGNWEWMSAVLEMTSPYRVFAVVKPLSDRRFEKYMTSLRTRFSTRGELIPFKNTLRFLVQHRRELSLTVIAGDQTPTKGEINYWTRFLNQDTPVFLGIEKIARSLDMAVVFMDIYRTRRGRYTAEINLITDRSGEIAEHEITQKYVGLLEQAIRQRPDNWLWSHRRWKHSRDQATEIPSE
jgi:KDO2-lipid IV(A) lauroyltransferase